MAARASDQSNSSASKSQSFDQTDLSESYFRVLTAQKVQLEEALRTEEHTKTVYEKTASELSHNLSELSSAEIDNVVRGKKLQALKEKLLREQTAREKKQLSTANLEKRVQLQNELITQMEMLLASHKLGDALQRSYGSTAATTLLSSGWRPASDPPEDQRIHDLEAKLQRLEEESSRQNQLTQRLCSELASLRENAPARPKSRARTAQKRRKVRTKSPATRLPWQRNCSACARC